MVTDDHEMSRREMWRGGDGGDGIDHLIDQLREQAKVGAGWLSQCCAGEARGLDARPVGRQV
jgi:hypothetical protein